MFRTSFVTGYAIFGGLVRMVTAHIDRTNGAVEWRTIGGSLAPVEQDTMWMTLRGGRNTIAAHSYLDGRFSKTGPSMFAFSTNVITDKKGKPMGRRENTVDFIAHMLSVSEGSTWHGETDADRQADAQILIQSLVS